MIIGVHHLGLKVRDPEHTQWLDHVCVPKTGGWRVGPNVCLKLDRIAVDPSNSCAARPVQLPGIAHICLQSRDINEGLALGEIAGLIPISGPVDLGTPFRYLYAHTDDGVLLELEGAPFVEDRDPRFWIGHVAFVAVDIVALVDFYARALGLAPSAVTRLGGNARIDQVAGLTGVELSAMWLPGFNLGLEFWQYHNPPLQSGQGEPATGFRYVCFQSTDFEADCTHVLRQGAGPAACPDLGLTHVREAAFRDPEGNLFVVLAFNNPHDPMAIENFPCTDILAMVAAQLHAGVKS
jgi:catechol 2,3-dioxygenase-like lactoylglutathione lyase family enzyme